MVYTKIDTLLHIIAKYYSLIITIVLVYIIIAYYILFY